MVNALEAMVLRGEIHITANMEPLSYGGNKSQYLRIDVRDTGPGIAPKDAAMLFDPFFTTKATGTGLGLSIVYSTIQSHGGEVRVSSDEGKGATFSILIPCAAKIEEK